MEYDNQNCTKQNSEIDISSKLDSLMAKYISVWLWSILFGGATTLTFSLVNVRAYEKWGSLSQVIGMLMIISISFVIMSWMTLLKFLQKHIIPGIFLNQEYVFEQQEKRKSSRYLIMSFNALILSGIVRLLMELAKNLFENMAF